MIQKSDTADREIIITRLINAPRELVWEVWTNPEHVKHWWGPNGFTNTIHEMSVKPGGVWRFMMHRTNGMDFPNRIVFNEVVKPERLTYIHGSDDENDPNIFHATITFEKQGNKTNLIMKSIFSTKEERDRVVKEYGAVEGGNQTLNRLEAYLTENDTADRELIISRTLNAPRELVWRAFTEPEHIKNWWGPDGFTNTIFTMDVKPGGNWEFIMHGPDGTDYKNKSIYKEIVKPERIVFDHISGPKFTTTITFISEGNKTKINWRMLFDSAQEFQQTVKTFKADEGLIQNINKLDNYLTNM